MQHAEPSDWTTQAMPAKCAVLSLERSFSADEMALIHVGTVPEEMEDKWFIYWHNNALSFHRSWTGFCIYQVRFERAGNSWRMIEATVNRDPNQYNQTTDAFEVRMISYLIDVLLLKRETPSPFDDPASIISVTQTWGQVGRAMLGQARRA